MMTMMMMPVMQMVMTVMMLMVKTSGSIERLHDSLTRIFCSIAAHCWNSSWDGLNAHVILMGF
jgi:hypothetical protein